MQKSRKIGHRYNQDMAVKKLSYNFQSRQSCELVQDPLATLKYVDTHVTSQGFVNLTYCEKVRHYFRLTIFFFHRKYFRNLLFYLLRYLFSYSMLQILQSQFLKSLDVQLSVFEIIRYVCTIYPRNMVIQQGGIMDMIRFQKYPC